jgi:hypothetical protein
MKSQSYMTRAMRAHDPRFANVLGKLGYERGDMTAAPPAPVEDITTVRAEYFDVVGKRAFNGWDIETLKAKIAEAKAKT